MFHAIAELLGHISTVIGKCFWYVPVLPSTLVMQGLRQIPMVKCSERFNARCLQLINQSIVKVKAFCIWFTRSISENSRPGDRKAVGIRTEIIFHHCNIFLVPVVMVIRNIAIIIVLNDTRFVSIGVPNRQAFSIFIPFTFNLV